MANRRRPRPANPVAQDQKSWAALKAAHRNTRVSVAIPWDADAADEASRLDADLRRAQEDDARENRHPQAPGIALRIQELEKQARDSEVTFTFEGIGRRAYQILLEENAATEEQRSQGLTYDPDTFPAALFAASCVQPEELHGNVEEWHDIHDSFAVGQVSRLWSACLSANAGVGDAPKSQRASAILGTNASAQS